MSRVGKMPIPIPSGTKVAVENGSLVAEGPKGKNVQPIFNGFPVEVEDGQVVISRPGDDRDARAKHGLLRALVANAVQGVTVGFMKELEIHGVGYRAEMKGRELHMALGFSHPVVYSMPEGVDGAVDKNGKITLTGTDRQKVGQAAAEIRSLKKPEPYKGKGIRYVDEVVRRKVGKAGAK